MPLILTTALRFALALVLLATLAATAGAGAQDTTRNGAGLVVRHGDGTLIYAYVEFDGASISGEELLLRSGLDLVVTPYGGLGLGVCAINGEGCPADNCYCESFSNPAYYWNYYTRSDVGWSANPRGPTSHQLADGDIDGWSWTTDAHGLPLVTIAEIAAITGFDRSPVPIATPPPAPTVAPLIPSLTATAAPTASTTPTAASVPSPPATPAPPSIAEEPPSKPTAPVTPTVPLVTATPTALSPTATEVQPTRTPVPSETPGGATSTTAPTTTATAATGAVIVRPGATPAALATSASSGGGADAETLVLFGGFVALIGAVGAFTFLRRRRGAQ